MRAFITGASGFIGRALGDRLRADGVEVRGMDLRADHARGVVAGDVAVAGDWQRHAEGCDLVIHTAAIVSLRTERPDDVWRANVLGTHHALGAAERAGARRFVHFSSVTAFGFCFPDRVTEEHPVRLTGLPYPDTKIASEQHVLQAHAEGRMICTVVRPGDVYGPASRAWAVVPVQLMRSRRFTLPAGGRGIFSPVYIDDLVDGVVRAASSEAADGQVLTLSGGVGIANRDFFGRYADALGTRLVTVPTPVAKGAAALVQLAARLQAGDNDINPRSIAYMTRTGTYANDKARRLLGWEPQVGVDEGLERTLAWLRAQNLLEA